jgi:VWFA-related protein
MKRALQFRRPNNVRVRVLTLLAALPALLLAQGPSADPVDPKDDRYRFGATVNVVTIPVTVTGPDKRLVAGLEKDQFRVFDNDKEQRILGFDVSFLPLSLVICVESSGRVEGLLPQVKKAGRVYTDLLLGEEGEAAVISYNSKVDVVQEFTRDSDRLVDAIKKIKVGSDATRTSDAVFEAIRMLRSRPDNRRKVILVIGETRDNGSEVHLGETLRTAELANITVYGVRLSTAKAKITQPAQTRRDPFPPGVSARPTAPGVVSTPTTQAQSHVEVVNALPFIIEAVRGVKNFIFNDPLQLLTEGTGGKQMASFTEGGLEDAVINIGQELRSQYLVSYRPNNLDVGGYHQIRVEVTMDGLKTRTRPGYWLGPIPKEQ